MVDRHDKVLVATMRITTNTNPHTLGDNKVKYWLNHLVVVIAAGKRPASIPNLEAKPASADGTAPGRVWESRTPPQHTSQMVGPVGTLSSNGPHHFSIRTRKTVRGLAPRPVRRPQGLAFFFYSHPHAHTNWAQHGAPQMYSTPQWPI